MVATADKISWLHIDKATLVSLPKVQMMRCQLILVSVLWYT